MQRLSNMSITLIFSSPKGKLLECPQKLLIQGLVRLYAYHRIKQDDPPLVWVPVNSFEFQPCDRTPQVVHLAR